MAPIPTTNTSRLVVDYSWRGRQYQTLYRWSTGLTLAAVTAIINDFHTASINFFSGAFSVTGAAVWYPEGINVGTELSLTTFPSGGGGADIASQPDAYQQQVLGRDAGGRRASWYYQGLYLAESADQRAQPGDSANVTGLLADFGVLVTEGLVTIAGNAPVIKPYVNQVYNDYLTRLARRG